ncbi:MAG: 30S ribosome-binding factor RbfA [Thiothrix sp.]|nr:30S ribosome-binding factor RbfA [Thiothrix sp.]HPQ96012.1 30S ribosome-binding factor RbfA [Thiolinea sp.]
MARHAPRGYSRTERVAEQLQRDLAVLIRERVKDPRVGMVTILDVTVSRDLAHAKVWFDVLDTGHAREAEESLNHAAGFLRHELGKGLKLRVTPELRFVYDDTQSRGNQLSALIERVVAEDRAAHAGEEADGQGHDDREDGIAADPSSGLESPRS